MFQYGSKEVGTLNTEEGTEKPRTEGEELRKEQSPR